MKNKTIGFIDFNCTPYEHVYYTADTCKIPVGHYIINIFYLQLLGYLEGVFMFIVVFICIHSNRYIYNA